MPPSRSSNGLAIAALVVGVLATFFGVLVLPFFLSLPLGGVALGLGIAGRRRAGEVPAAGGNGQATAGMVLGIIGMVLGVLGLVLVLFVIDFDDSAPDGIGGTAPRSTYDLDEGSCFLEDDDVVAEGTITNTTDRTRSYQVVVTFVDNGERVARSSDVVHDVEGGEQADYQVQAGLDGDEIDDCRVFRVNRVT